MKKFITLWVLSVWVVLLAWCGTNTSTPWTVSTNNQPTQQQPVWNVAVAWDLASLAQCINANNLRMYWTEWCGHCQNQKRMFGDAFEFIDFIDCDQNRGTCQSAWVRGYPTWIDDNNNLYPWTQNVERLAQIAWCEYQPEWQNQWAAVPVADPEPAVVDDQDDDSEILDEDNNDPVEEIEDEIDDEMEEIEEEMNDEMEEDENLLE